MAMTDLTIIRRSMTARLFSTITTMAMVSVSVALLLVLLCLPAAGNQAFARGSGNMHLLVSRDTSPLVGILNGIFYAGAPRNYMEWSKYESIANRYPLEYAIPTQLGDSYRGIPVLATTPGFFKQFRPGPEYPWDLIEGGFLRGTFDVVVGSVAAKTTGLKVGDPVHLAHGMGGTRDAGANRSELHDHDEFEFTVVGVLRPTGTPHDRVIFTNLTSSWLVHAHDRRKRADPTVEHTGIEDLRPEDRRLTGIFLRVMTRGNSNVSAILPTVFDELRKDDTITVAQPKDEIDKLFAIVSNVNDIFLGMAGVVMISSGIAIMLALYNSMEQRRRQIAVLRVLGCSRGRIFSLVITESAVLGFVGAAVGVVLCLGGLELVAMVMQQRFDIVISTALEPKWGAGAVLATTLIASVAGVVPAFMAYRTPVAQNLRPLG